MMSKYLEDLIARYERGEISGADACDNITRITNKEEFILDVNENRKRERLTSKYDGIRLGKSAEDVVIGWEEDERILHYLDWIRQVLTEREWYVFSQYTLHPITRLQLAEKMGVSRQNIDRYLSRVHTKIKKLTPYYDDQFGNLYEYLKG